MLVPVRIGTPGENLTAQCAAMPQNGLDEPLCHADLRTRHSQAAAGRRPPGHGGRHRRPLPGRAGYPGTGGIRKLLCAGSGRGKCGGIRAIYFWHADPDAIYMLTAYAKADRDDLTAADRKALVRLVTAIERERQEG